MTSSEPLEPWEQLTELVERDDREAIARLLTALALSELPRVLDRLKPDERARVLLAVEPALGALIIEHMPELQAADAIERLAPHDAAAILEALPSDEQADLLTELEPEEVEAIVAEMTPEEAEQARELVRYPKHVAGGLMLKEYVAYPREFTVEQVVRDLRAQRDRYQDYNVLYAYVIDGAGRLAGVLRLRNLLISPEEAALDELAAAPISVSANASLDELEAAFDRYPFLALPVVDADGGRLVGVVERGDVIEALGARSDDAYRASQGIVLGEEVRSMPTFVRAGRRLSWLSVNIGLNIMAASVIAFFQDTLSAVIALAVFLPIISDMSGCSGNQAVAVSVRELTLGLIKPTDLFRVWRQELVVGVVNGVALGCLIAGVAWAWKGNPYLGLVVGAALAINTVVAVTMGGLLPLGVKRLGRDPALASGPILTTVTDMCGFLLVLGLATLLLPLLRAV